MYDTTIITFADFWEHTAQKAILSIMTEEYQEYLNTLIKGILDDFGSRRLADVKTEDINNYFYRIRHENAGMRRNRKALLKKIFNLAVRNRLIKSNPVIGSECFPTPYCPVYKLTDESMHALMRYHDASLLCCLLKAQLYSGLSLSELAGLRETDLHEADNRITIDRFCRFPKRGAPYLSQQYARKQLRTVRILPQAMQALTEAQTISRQIKSPSSSTNLAAVPDLVFVSGPAQLLTKSKIRNYYSAVGNQVGITNLSGTMLEDNFGLRAAALKVNPKDLHVYLGHASYYTVARYYDFCDREYLPPAVAAETYFARILEEPS